MPDIPNAFLHPSHIMAHYRGVRSLGMWTISLAIVMSPQSTQVTQLRICYDRRSGPPSNPDFHPDPHGLTRVPMCCAPYSTISTISVLAFCSPNPQTRTWHILVPSECSLVSLGLCNGALELESCVVHKILTWLFFCLIFFSFLLTEQLSSLGGFH